MGLVLLLDGTTRDDGLPNVTPRNAWIPTWAGGTRTNPGVAASYAADLPDSLERTLRLPQARYGAPHLVASDVAEAGYPLRQANRPGLLFERSRTQLLVTADWNPSNWSVLVDIGAISSGQRGPTGGTTGTDQAYEFASTATGGYISLKNITVSSMDGATVVFDVWLRKPTGTSGTIRVELRNSGGGTASTKDFSLTDKWQHCWVTSPNVAAVLAEARIYPGGVSGTGTVQMWGPQMIDTGAAVALTGRGRHTTIDPSSTSVLSKLTGAFSWPAPPWSVYAVFRPTWQANDGLGHGCFGAWSSAGTDIFALRKTNGNVLQALVRDRRGTNQTATITPSGGTFVHDYEWRVLVQLSSAGALDGYLNGTPFTSQIAAPTALPDGPPTQLDVGDGNTASIGALDGVLHRLEIWSGTYEPERWL